MSDEPFVHPLASCDSVDLGAGTRVWGFAVVQSGAVVGAHCNVCSGAFIEAGSVVGNHVTVKNGVAIWDGVTVEDEVFLGPNLTFTNDLRPRAHTRMDAPVPTYVESGATLGANATIVCGTRIGRHSMVGAGAVVTKDVAPHALMVGNPARRIGWVCVCAERLADGNGCGSCGRTYDWVAGQPTLTS